MKKFIFFILIIVAAGCGKPADEKMHKAARIYIEGMLLDEKYSFKPDTIHVLRDKLFEKYKFSKEEFKSFLNSMEKDQKKWNEFFTFSEQYLDSLKTQDLLK